MRGILANLPDETYENIGRAMRASRAAGCFRIVEARPGMRKFIAANPHHDDSRRYYDETHDC